MDRTFFKSLKAQYHKKATGSTYRHPDQHNTKARFCEIFSDAWNKTAVAGRAAKRFECTGMTPFSADLF